MTCEPIINGVPAGVASLQALDWKNSVRAASTAATAAATLVGNVLTANANGALPVVDGIALIVNESVLLKDQVGGDALENGIYTVTDLGSAGTPWILTRRSDADTSADVTTGMTCYVEEGTTLTRTVWTLVTLMPIVLNTTALLFVDIISTAASTWATVLAAGAVSGANNPQISNGQALLPVTDTNPSIGSAALRFNSGFYSNAVLVAGATQANGAPDADEVVVGDGAGNEGMSLFVSAAGFGRYSVTDATGAARGEFRYQDSVTQWVIGIAAADAYTLVPTALSPAIDIAADLGIVTTRWRDAHIGRAVLIAGATQAAATAAADDLVVGTISAADFGITILSGTANTGALNFTDVSNTLIGAIQYSHPNSDMRFVVQGTTEAILSATAWFPASSGGNALGQTTNFWAKSYINTIVCAIQTIGDGGTATIGASRIINVTAPTAASTVTLPTAVAGDEYYIDVVDATASVIVDAAAGDTINGGVVAGNATISVAGLYHLYAFTTTDWRLHGPLALGPASA